MPKAHPFNIFILQTALSSYAPRISDRDFLPALMHTSEEAPRPITPKYSLYHLYLAYHCPWILGIALHAL